MRLAYRLYQLIWETEDWIYPPSCGGCGEPGTRWCDTCAGQTPELHPPLCSICGNPSSGNSPCARCQAVRPDFTALRAYAEYRGLVREAILRYKYGRDMGLGEALSRPMIATLQKLNWSLDIITSVPLGLARMKERGYNQATLLARPIALHMRLPFSRKLLKRSRETPSQVGLTVTERRKNMMDAFTAERELVQGKNILVIDDVATSGATINACANALLDEGASRVYGFTLARAVYTPAGDIDIT